MRVSCLGAPVRALLPLVVSILLAIAVKPGSSARAETLLDEAQRQEIVSAHNRWRGEVGAPELRWTDDLAHVAQRWADQLRLSRRCTPEHNKGTNLGENLYWASAVRWSDGRVEIARVMPSKVVDSWGGEKGFYDHTSNRCRAGKVCGHYTQVVWRDSTEVGCGMAVCANASQVWVCNYRPPGNYVGQKPY